MLRESGLLKLFFITALIGLSSILIFQKDASAATRLKVTLLGDSYIAGNGARKADGSTDNYGPRGCYRSNSNWGKQYVDQLKVTGYNISLINRACSGSVSNDLLYDNDMEDEAEWVIAPSSLGLPIDASDEAIIEAAREGRQCEKRETAEEYYRLRVKSRSDDLIWLSCTRFVKAQLNFVDESSDVVLLSVGGNDIKFSDIVMKCLAPIVSSSLGCSRQIEESRQRAIGDAGFTDYNKNATEIFKRLREKLRSDAKIVLVGYPYLAKDDNFVLKDLFNNQSYEASKNVRELGRLGDEVQRSIIPEEEPDKASVYFFDGVKEYFAGHEPDMNDFWHHNEDKWIHTFGSRISTDWFHYNPTGHQQVANVLFEKLEDAVDGFPLRTKQDYDVVFVYNESADAQTYQKDDLAMKGIVMGNIRDKILSVADTARFGIVGYNLYVGSDGRTGPKSDLLHDFTTDIYQLSTKMPRSTTLAGKTHLGELKNGLDIALDMKWRPGVKKLIYIIGKTTKDDQGFIKEEYYKDTIKKALEIDPVAISPIMAANNSVANIAGVDGTAQYLAGQTEGTYNQQAKTNDYSSSIVGKQINANSVATPYAWAGEGLNTKVGETVTLDGSGSYDATGITSYQWDMNLDGEYEISATEPGAEYEYNYEYQGLVTLRVANAQGKTATATFPALVTRDGDSVPDEIDNCIDDWNEDQEDADGDGLGDLCDESPGRGSYVDPSQPSIEEPQPDPEEAPEDPSPEVEPDDDEPETEEGRDQGPEILLPQPAEEGVEDDSIFEKVLNEDALIYTGISGDQPSNASAIDSSSYGLLSVGFDGERKASDPKNTEPKDYTKEVKNVFSSKNTGDFSWRTLFAAGSLAGVGAGMWFLNLRLLEEEEL